ncbi:hypothetical protein P3T31_004664 [Rhizobium sp. AN70]|nr:hypothetical protein [Rhizobium sp. AN70]
MTMKIVFETDCVLCGSWIHFLLLISATTRCVSSARGLDASLAHAAKCEAQNKRWAARAQNGIQIKIFGFCSAGR